MRCDQWLSKHGKNEGLAIWHQVELNELNKPMSELFGFFLKD